MITQWFLLLAELILGIVGIVGSHGQGHGIFNGPMGWDHPESGRRASKWFGITQLVMCVITVVVFKLQYFNEGWSLLIFAVGFVVSLLVGVVVLYVLARMEENTSRNQENEI